jgi:hypothetical protein
VGDLGWESSCWSDDNLSSKKLYPGYQFPSKSKKWVSRLKTTPESMALFVQRVQTAHEKRPDYMRKKMDQSSMEAFAERAAALWHLAEEIKLHTPLPAASIDEHWLSAWAEGSDHVEMELQSLLLDKNEMLDIATIPTFKRLLDQHLFNAPVQAKSGQADAILVDEFNLFMNKLKYDVQVFENWQKKCVNVFAAREHAKQDHRLAQHAMCTDAAQLVMDATVKLSSWNTPESIIGEIMNFRRDYIARKLGCDTAKIPIVCFLNWSAPCVISSTVQDAQCNVLSWVTNDNMQSVGVVLYPVFTYQKGKLHLEESKVTQQLTKANHNLDIQFSVLFAEQVDARDLRPMVYPGRFVFPSPLGDPSKSMWFNCKLRKMRRTQEIKQLAAKFMKETEDLSADALPPSIDLAQSRVQGGLKYCQLGVQAWQALMAGTFEGPCLADVPGILVLDLYPRVGDLAFAFCKHRNLQNQNSTSLFYFGVCEDQREADWISSSLKEDLVENYVTGSVALPNNQKISKELPHELLEPLPALPKMNILITTGDDEKKLHIPGGLVKKWQFHERETLSKEFVQWLDVFAQTHSVLDETDVSAVTGSGQKRINKDGDSETPSKKAKIDSAHVVESSKIEHALLVETKLPKDNLFLQLRAGHRLYICNKGPAETTLDQDFFIAGFGKGNFKLMKESDSASDYAVEFKLQSSDDLVCFNGKICAVGTVVADQREKKPDCQICYHKLTPADDNPKKFVLQQTHRIAFHSTTKEDGGLGPGSEKKNAEGKNQPAEVNQGNFAVKEPVKIWQGSPSMHVLWTVRWAAKGLMPVKPCVYLKAIANLGVGRSLSLNATAD